MRTISPVFSAALLFAGPAFGRPASTAAVPVSAAAVSASSAAASTPAASVSAFVEAVPTPAAAVSVFDEVVSASAAAVSTTVASVSASAAVVSTPAASVSAPAAAVSTSASAAAATAPGAAVSTAAYAGASLDSFADIERIEDARAQDSNELREALRAREPARRARAARAMGRIGAAGYLPALAAALGDGDAGVREEAAFAVGLAAAQSTAPARQEILGALEAGIEDASSAVRLACVEALGRAAGAFIVPRLEGLLSHRDMAVRQEAALALFRLRFAGRIEGYSTSTVQGLVDGLRMEVPGRWVFAYVFSRWPEPAAAGSLAEAISAEDARTRLFALRGLARLGAKAPPEAGEEAFKDGDPRVRAEALALLKACGTPERLPPAALDDDSAHVRAAAAALLGEPGSDDSSLRRLLLDAAPVVRAEAYASLARLLREKALVDLRRAAGDSSWWVRARAAEAAAELSRSGPGLLEQALKDEDLRVRCAALSALARAWPRKVRPQVEAVLRDPESSLELRGTAVEIAAQSKDARYFDALREAYRNSFAREFVELRESAVEAAALLTKKGRPEDARERFLAFALEDPAPSVRAKAAAALGRPVPALERPADAPGRGGPALAAAPVRAGESALSAEAGGSALSAAPSPLPPGRAKSAARVLLRTGKGEILIALETAQASAHAANFLALARKGFYDGLQWHRLAPNFVVQGGDPRGTGWGDAGYFLRDEINPLRFSRGAVGMPKAGKDTGGCQLFIVTVDAPHLDGRYTLFGRVVSGMDVVDRLEPGDRIFKALVQESAAVRE